MASITSYRLEKLTIPCITYILFTKVGVITPNYLYGLVSVVTMSLFCNIMNALKDGDGGVNKWIHMFSASLSLFINFFAMMKLGALDLFLLSFAIGVLYNVLFRKILFGDMWTLMITHSILIAMLAQRVSGVGVNWFLVLCFTFGFHVFVNFKNFKDADKDAQQGIRTLATVFDKALAKQFAKSLLLFPFISMALVGLYTQSFYFIVLNLVACLYLLISFYYFLEKEHMQSIMWNLRFGFVIYAVSYIPVF